MKEVSFFERVTVTVGSLELIGLLNCPSIKTSILFGLRISIVRLEFAGKTTGRKSVNGHIGVKTKAFTLGSKTGPPADNE